MRHITIGLSIVGLSICLAVQCVCAQESEFKGKVVDSETGDPLPAASVTIELDEFKTGTITDGDGAFSLIGLKPGRYRITISYVGYAQKVLRSERLRDRQSRDLTIRLDPNLLYLNPITVSASRRPERVIEAPAEVSVIEAAEIANLPSLTPAEHLRGIQSVDFVSTGVSSGRIVVRGFNGSFSGRLLTLTDNRIANVPALRLNALQWIPSTDDDIDKMEVIEGPASAIYGPNAAGGVLHIITKSPFESEGTKIGVGVGERDLRVMTVRHAGSIDNRVGFKISAKYQQATDWPFEDAGEPDSLVRGYQRGLVRTNNGIVVSNARDQDIRELSMDGRLDFHPSDDLKVILAGGFASVSNIEITGIGSYQVKDWVVGYGQARMIYKDLFAQVFLNRNNEGNTVNLRSGNHTIDNSWVLVTQAQHGFSVRERNHLTYGVDVLITRPDSDGTLYGRNESATDLNQYGYFAQLESKLTDRLKFVGAGRIDHQNTLDEVVFSPRTALVYTTENDQSFRVTFNRAFQMPEVLGQFLDINVLQSLGGLPMGIQLVGTPPSTGWHFDRNVQGGVGGLSMQSPFSASGPDVKVPAEATQLWPATVAIMEGFGVDLSEIPAPAANQVATDIKVLDGGAFVPLTPQGVGDIEPLAARKSTTLEIGYKGVLSDKLYVTANAYREWTRNAVQTWFTPNIFYNEADLAVYLAEHMSSEDAAGLASSIAGIPMGTILPREINQKDVMLSFRHSKKTLRHYGLEAGLRYYVNDDWTINLNHTYRSVDVFESDEPLVDDISFNAPQHRFGGGIKYDNDDRGIDARIRVSAVNSAFIFANALGEGTIPAYTLVDFNGGFELPWDRRFKLSVSVNNLLNNKHTEFIGAPEIGRMSVMRLQYSID